MRLVAFEISSVSVSLAKLIDAPPEDFERIEVMAPDYDVAHIWLWDDNDGENRIDLGRQQMRQLRDVLNELLEASGANCQCGAATKADCLC